MVSNKKTRKGKISKSSGRFGVRYGRKDRKLISSIEEKTKMNHICIKCDQPYVKRTSTAIWECKKCGYKFAGGTYIPETSIGQTFKNSLKNAVQDHSKDYYYDFLDEDEN